MRTLVLILLLGITAAYGQPNQYLQNHPSWEMEWSDGTSWPCARTDRYNFYVQGDTVINTFVYKQVFRKGNRSYTNISGQPGACSSGSFAFMGTYPSFFLRSTADRKMYLKPVSGVEFLLYDFGGVVGDSIFYHLPSVVFNTPPGIIDGPLSGMQGALITDMDSIYANGRYLRRFTTEIAFDEVIFIEGVGHGRGLVEPIHNAIEVQYQAFCYSANDTIWPVYGNGPNQGTCNLQLSQAWLGVEEIHSGWNIYPNPASDHVYIDQQLSSQPFRLLVFNTLGQCIVSTTASASPFQLDVNGLPPGIYIVHIQFAQGEFQHRFMKY